MFKTVRSSRNSFAIMAIIFTVLVVSNGWSAITGTPQNVWFLVGDAVLAAFCGYVCFVVALLLSTTAGQLYWEKPSKFRDKGE